jgi:hypothetical protein
MTEFSNQANAKRTLLNSFASPLTSIAAKRDRMICREMASRAWGLDLDNELSI